MGTFAVNASPPVGSPLAYDPTKEVVHPLSCRGVVLVGEGRPVVLCAVDWIGISNDGQTEFRKALAEAARTGPGRVAVHALHQHDAPACDFTTTRLTSTPGIGWESRACSTFRSMNSTFGRPQFARLTGSDRE